MKKLNLVLFAILLAIPMTTYAIDRDAKMIDSVEWELQELDDIDGYTVMLTGETALQTEGERWAILFGVGPGEISPDGADDINLWKFRLGMKYYLTPITAISALAHYEVYDTQEDETNVKAGEVLLKQRLASPDAAVSPYALASVAYRDRSTFSDAIIPEGSVSEYVFKVGGGCEFKLGDNVSWIVEGYAVQADASDDESEDLDGVMGTVALRYYFMPDRF